MAKQKRSHAVRRRDGSSRGHGLAWFLAGVLAGGFVTWVILGRDPAAERVRTTVERTVGHSVGIDTTAPPPKPKFEFYTLLPEQEVVVSDEELPAPGPVPDSAPAESGAVDTKVATAATVEDDAPSEAEAALTPGHYILQVASFKSMKDADGLKAKLTLLGFRPVVQTVAIDSNEKWHRVRIGPYANRDSLEAARVRLRADGHDNPLVVWVKKG